MLHKWRITSLCYIVALGLVVICENLWFVEMLCLFLAQ